MHRFRKKSDTRRSAQVPFSASSDTLDEPDNSPQIPLPNDFRTSLILPDLSRRFSLLRSPSGEPVALEILKNRFAEQRARGSENHISEEEEEMILDTLRGIRSKPTAVARESEERLTVPESDSPSVRQSIQSTSTMESSVASTSPTSSPSGRSAKRYSNNLFGSGRFRDYTYMRSVTKNGSTRTQSLTPTESSYRGNTSSIADSLRPVTPEGGDLSSSTPSSSPDDRVSSVRSAPLAPSNPYGEQSISVAEYRIAKTLGPSALKRTSMALAQVIKEIEEEAEDEIVMPRSTPIPRSSSDQPSFSSETVRNSGLSHSSIYEAVMAISPDKPTQNNIEYNERRASPVPSRILPGYVPGMPRPMTPRDFDPDDQRSHSTTPRATSPTAATFTDSTSVPVNVASGRPRRDSASSQSAPRSPTSPLFLQRSTNGRYTPDDGNRDNYTTEFDNPLNSSILTRRRPASPLSGPPYQPMAVSSRPGTPSNIVWTTSPRKSTGHSRNGSWVSDGGVSSSDVHGASDRHTPSSRAVQTPALPDSPTLESPPANLSSFPSHNRDNPASENQSYSKMSSVNASSPIRVTRSVTPTQNTPRSPASPTFSDVGVSSKHGNKRSSKQNAPSSLIPPLIFSPLINSSRSSLESAGSSYHTWDGEEKDRSFTLFGDPDVSQPVWHDISSSDKSITPGGSPEDEWDPEEIVAHYGGLKKSDFMAIQERLVIAAIERPERAGSSMRRRRPSTSQSNYSINGRDIRIASPPPQTQSPPNVKTGTTSTDNPPSIPPSAPSKDKETSPTTRRNRDLAQALFGKEEAERQEDLLKSQFTGQNSDEPLKSASANTQDTLSSPSSVTPYQMPRNPSMPRIPQTPQEEAEMAREVQQRMNAATLALKKSPLSPSLLTDPYATVSRKRISPNQISTPRLVSASTSVDTVPIVRTPSLSSTNNSGPSKIGSRFKKLRGTLRAKNIMPTGEEVTPYPLDLHSPHGQMASYDSARLKVPGVAVTASATESRFKVPVPSPPASAGPGLKGFMARFRGKQRAAPDSSSEADLRRSPHSTSPMPTSSHSERGFPQHSTSSQSRDVAPDTPRPRPETPQVQSAPPTQTTYALSLPADSNDNSALRQLFDAANKIGLDEGELSALLARSGSTSSRTLLTRSNSGVQSRADTPADPSRLTPSIGRPSIDEQSMRAVTPDPKANGRGSGRPSLDNRPPRDKPVSRQGTRKQADHARRPREGQGGDRAASTIIRRTIIFPESKMTADELTALMEKSPTQFRRASTTSVSNRSIHDRAPTPPPPRSPTAKRFSNGPSPPVPNLPTNLNVPSTSAGGPIEKSNSTYDSLYDMYAGESRSPSATPHEPEVLQSTMAPESGAAVQLVEMANGETIWSIVNGLRDDDEESVYTGRASFTSEYSTREASTEGGLQIFVKEHGRSGSKGSTSSFVSRKRAVPGKQRPETKVFYSPSANIGRLIEDISQNMDAGSFNFLPNRPPGHSASSSLSTNDLTWNVEEQLDKMLDTVRPT